MRALPAAALLLLAASASAQDRRMLPGGGEWANPGAVVAAEIAFAQAAQAKGQWTAFAESATADAVMFVPQMTWAQAWLKGRANPPAAVRWQPHEVWSSCDGSLAVTHGAWQGGKGGNGWFTTVWQRQNNGKYRWVLDHGDALEAALPAPEMVAAHVADCPARGPGAMRAKLVKLPKVGKLPPLDAARRTGRSNDGTLSWDVAVTPAGARTLTVFWTKDGRSQTARIDQVAAPKT